ncbi:MAG: tRNA glutamyl-Q(34) synthetase GluQRS [Thermodesulfobacteriota bacterium]|nr:tRNA glutamyl-Q(34) synthetase GluQRS [Thermodesulfobacteriota bacterium]
MTFNPATTIIPAMSLTHSIQKTIGRFAPSPTGHLHFGSLIAAVASYCMAKQSGGEWLLRIDDLDQPRVVAGAADIIMHQLETFGLLWDRSVVYQSERSEIYRAAIERLKQVGLTYPCSCSRREILASAPHLGEEGAIYPGTCRHKIQPTNSSYCTRITTPDNEILFNDGIYGPISQNLAREVGDFPLQRADGIFSYQLAVAVDDHACGVNQVVRGRDLLFSTPRQIHLLQQLGYAIPTYTHIPLVLSLDGEKISKRHHQVGDSLEQSPSTLLYLALDFLGQHPPKDLCAEQPATIVVWACSHFNLQHVTPADRVFPLK